MKADIIGRSYAFWRRVEWLRRQPEPAAANENRRLKRTLGVGLSILLGAIGTALMTHAYNYSATTQNMRSQSVMLPDVVVCPRKGFALYADGFAENGLSPDVKLRLVGNWYYGPGPRSVKVYQRRATAHEHYKYTVWYNYRMIELLNMTRSDVDDLTDIVRDADRRYQPLPSHLRVHAHKARSLCISTYEHDLTLVVSKLDCLRLNCNITFEQSRVLHHWQTPLHPFLQEILATHDQTDNVNVLWWTITEPRYVEPMLMNDYFGLSLEEQTDNEISIKLRRRLNRFLSSIPIIKPVSLWVNDHYCMMFPYRLMGDSDMDATSVMLDSPDTLEDAHVWFGNIRASIVNMKKFIRPATDADGWHVSDVSYRVNFGVHHVTFDAARERRKPVCQPHMNIAANPPHIRTVICNDTKVVDFEFYEMSKAPSPSPTHIQLSNTDHNLDMQLIPTYSAMSADHLVSSSFMYWLYIDIQVLIDPNQRYKTALYFNNTSELKHPGLVVQVGSFYLGAFNSTRLSKLNITPDFLNYLTAISVGMPYYVSHPEVRFSPAINLSLTSMFVTVDDIPEEEKLIQLKSQFENLAASLDLSPELPFNVLKHFLVDKCRLIIRCQINGREIPNCGQQWSWTVFWYSFAIDFGKTNQNALTLRQGHNMSVEFDVALLDKSSYFSVPYLGPIGTVRPEHVNLTKLKNSVIKIHMYSTNEVSSKPETIFMTRSISARQQIRIDVTGTVTILHPDAIADNCQPTPITSLFQTSVYLKPITYMVAKLCGCSLCLETPLNITQLSDLFNGMTIDRCCTATDMHKCMVQSSTYNNKGDGTGITNPFYPFLAKKLTPAEIQNNYGVPACHSTRWTTTSKTYFDSTTDTTEIVVQFVDMPVVGSHQYDSLDQLELILGSLGTASLFLGVSLVAIIWAVIQRRKTDELTMVSSLKTHWKRCSAYLMSNDGDQKTEIVSETPRAHHVFIVVLDITIWCFAFGVTMWLFVGSGIFKSMRTDYVMTSDQPIPVPTAAVCIRGMISHAEIKNRLQRLTCWSEGTQGYPCSPIFPLYYKSQLHHNLTCAMTPHQPDAVDPTPIQFAYATANETSAFEFMWLGDTRVQNFGSNLVDLRNKQAIDVQYLAMVIDLSVDCTSVSEMVVNVEPCDEVTEMGSESVEVGLEEKHLLAEPSSG